MRFNRSVLRTVTLWLALPALILSACQSPQPSTPTATPPIVQPTVPVPTPTLAPRTLSICVGSEPETLFLYGGSSTAMWSVLEAIYDGPIDQRAYAEQPVILEKLPSLDDGSIALQPVDVVAGDEVVDAQGNLNTLGEGVRVYPSGCTSADCAVAYDGQSPLQMDQMKVTYQLLPDLKWSDGAPLTAADSVYSFTLASDAALPVSHTILDRTVSYRALDEQTVEWVGKPGFKNSRLSATFWIPAPQHVWGQMAAQDLLQSEQAAVRPVGWGPYVIDEWVKGDHITLSKNPNYFRSGEGLPYFDHLVYRFLGSNGSANLSSLTSGECDLLDQTTFLEDQIQPLIQLQEGGQFKGYFAAGPEWEHLDFGIKPASYDDGYNPAAGDRPDLFGDPRTRQAFALCADRQGAASQALFNRTQVPNTYLPPQHPLADPEAKTYPYDPAAGAKLLDEAGWKDPDGNPQTPRIAQGVANVPDGTPLTVNYWTTEAPLRQTTSQFLANSMAGCGIQVNLKYYTPGELYAAGPSGPVFGRAFDLVQFTWEGNSLPLCYLYVSSQIPDPSNQWVGVNVSGYSNPEYDAGCEAALNSLPGTAAYIDGHKAAQEIFAGDLPVIPLYLHPKVAASRADLCGYDLDPTARSSLWSLENVNYGGACQQ